jgi:hypothetical protein
MLGDGVKWLTSYFTEFGQNMTLMYYKLMDKITVGDKYKKLAEDQEKAIKDTQEQRTKIEEDLAARRKANLQAEKDAEAKKLADEKAAAAAAANQENADKAKASKRAEDREARKERRAHDAIKNKENAELSAIDKKEEREKAAAEEAKGVTVDKSDPIQMLKTFSAQQKSALTQEAKALDDKEKARSDLVLANQEMTKAIEQSGKATNDMERKAAAERIKAAEERLSKTTKANDAADDTLNKAKERMALAKQGKDPGAVAAGAPTTAATTATPSATATPTVDTAAVTQGVGNLYQQTQDAMNKGIKYGFGSKDLKTGAIDCSGWIANINTNMMNSINKEAGKEIYGKEAKKAFQGSAADIIKNVSAAGGGMLEGSKNIRANLKEGMLIGEDNGEKGWDAGRHKGIDHITQTVKDPKTGKLMISESQGGKGVTMTDPEEYFKRKEAKGVKLFGTDMTAMAKGAEGRVTAPPSATANIPKPEDAAKARTEAAQTDPRRTDKTPPPQAQGEVKKEEGASGTLQGLMRDGILPTTMAFQDLVSKGIKPFQGMLSGIQTKTPLKSEVPVKESLSPGEQVVPDKGTVKPEDSLKAGEQLVKATAEAQAKIAQASITSTRNLTPEERKPTETYTINGKPASKEEFDKFMKDNPELAKMMGKGSGAQLRDPGTGELLSAAKDLSKSAEAQLRDPGTGELLSAAKDLSGIVTTQDSSSDQAKAVQAAMTEGAKFMLSGFDTFATDLSGGMTKTFSFVGTDLSSTFSNKLRGTFDDSLGLFNTDLADNLSAFDDFESVLTDMPQALADSAIASNDEIKSTRDDMWSRADDILEKAQAEGRAMTEDEKAQRNALFQAGNTLSDKMNANFAEISNKSTNMAASETPKAEIVAAAEKEAAAKIKAAEEAAAEKERQAQAGTMLAGNSQEGALSGSSDLNTALAELIAISRKTADLNEKQLSVQSSLSGDLFA